MNPNPRKSSVLRRGFTLIELLVVMLILAILAAMIVPRIMSRTGEAKISAARGDLVNLRKALNLFYIDVGSYPTTEEGLEALRTPPSDAAGWKGPYLEKPVPTDPWGYQYAYEFPGPDGDASFYLYCTGSDGAPGGSGDAADIIESGE
ncbi:MAG: type II secretion system major pseudopilin GspG [Armatimonadetes bacterium]|nr:type II secretion system major pseudopilin GspG [Armatimonadota bacterium]MBS1711776.1 type II secretion system major pseudopilin GspG [Armatimonadota bacterium]MBX3109670.1 type II secretion system major pseudopilin GspG [Fimbriimonadaceae bacterium]